ncbi:MAG: putative lipoprotein [Actinomycetia bacterium]|nr:putative lipoprotein [Actinomycetes bacterium]
MTFTQVPAGVRFEWGPAGATVLAEGCAVLVVVDVLSFSTATAIAVERGIRVHPFPWRGDEAREYAIRIGAVAAGGRGSGEAWTLSPADLLAAPVVPDLVLPSPNGSAICAAAASTGASVVAACARNAAAVASWLLTSGYGTEDQPIGIVAAGERWPDGSLRPSAEDLLGAALVLDGLTAAPAGLSVEAAVALAALTGVGDVAAAIRGSSSGRELITKGFPADVEIAVDLNGSEVVPLVRAGAFEAAI